jgi:Ca2+-binding RTX toxin-like protein
VARFDGTDGDDTYTGTPEADDIFGYSGNDSLSGANEDDYIDGGAGADEMWGGAGSDTYVVGSAHDRVHEMSGEGNDLVLSSISYTLQANVERLTLTGKTAITGSGNALSNEIRGNAMDNILDGGAGNDILDGGSGADQMWGRSGNDTYVVGSAHDRVHEEMGDGFDTIRAETNYWLSANVEQLELTGKRSINGSGNELDNILIGNSASNVLDGKSGADSMDGGSGTDTFVVDNVGDFVIDHEGQDGDLILSSISYNLSSSIPVENLTLTGEAAINGSGNNYDNVITGNSGHNTLDGGNGRDTVIGGAGHDIVRGGGNSPAGSTDRGDKLFGGKGNDILAGGIEAEGYQEEDGFYFDTGLNARSNVDTIVDFQSTYDGIYLDDSVFKAAGGTGTLSQDAFVIGNSAMDASDRIIFDREAGEIYYDADGTGAAAQVLFAKLEPMTDLSYSDFIVY